MLKRFFSRRDSSSLSRNEQAHVTPLIEEQGLSFPLSLAEQDSYWSVAAYLDQLFEEDFATQLSDRWLLPWDALHQLLDAPEHAASLPLLGGPPLTTLRPQLASSGSLAEPGFQIFIQGWRDPYSQATVHLERTGAVIHHAGGTQLLPQSTWALLQAVQQLHRAQQETPGETTNQVGWALVRKLAKNAQAGLDGFLDKTVVVKPERLQLKPHKVMIGDIPVIELEASFDGQPPNWMASFDGYKQVQDTYRISGSDGSVTHVLIEPEVKAVLESVRGLPGRRVAGDEALTLIRNPYTVIGDAAQKVLDPAQYEAALAEAGIHFHRFKIEPVWAAEGTTIQTVNLHLEPVSASPQPAEALPFQTCHEFALFVRELELKLAAGMPAGLWQGFELEMSDFDLAQLTGIQALLAKWQAQEAGQVFEAVLDLSSYGDRVIGIGEAERITSPFLVKEAAENWLPPDVKAAGLDSVSLPQWTPSNREHFHLFEQRLDQAREEGEGHVELPGCEIQLPLKAAEQLYEVWSRKLQQVENDAGTEAEKLGRAVLQIAQNIEETTYATRREVELRAAHAAIAQLPDSLREDVHLREHQLKGVAWMQHLFHLAPKQVTGCLLADDMGLGKTIQLLTFVAHYLEQHPAAEPVLIIAPVSLLDNWERELQRFFYTEALPVLKLYGRELSMAKFKKEEIPLGLHAKGIKNLLRPGWIGHARIVLTTYETLRDQEFSLARQRWAIMVCDEAQKIKNPAALITQAAKAIPARFRVACTGTPVENSLIDLWSLFDFIQPGLLGSLNQFGHNYQQPIETAPKRDAVALEQLRTLIEPQTLRRTKQDVAKDLPAKIEDLHCRSLPMHLLQRKLYLGAIADFSHKQQFQEHLQARESGMLGLLHTLKLICAHPYSVQPDPQLRTHSPKLHWLLGQLDAIQRSGSGDKVIIFTELRDIQRELQHAILQRFGFKPTIINGETSTSSQSAQSRQRLIDGFQNTAGFSVIILSTVAVGFGVNVQAANHVIHFTRCWNPAKEDQATDRAYRIGQEKDVYVYYPTIRDTQMPTFESTLDELLDKRRALARDMLQAPGEIQTTDFGNVLSHKG